VEESVSDTSDSWHLPRSDATSRDGKLKEIGQYTNRNTHTLETERKKEKKYREMRVKRREMGRERERRKPTRVNTLRNGGRVTKQTSAQEAS
jgi:hypothetical protein